MSANPITYRSILFMTIPVMLGMLAEFIVSIINSAFLSRVDGPSFVAAGNAGLIYISLMMIGYGIAGASQIVIARRDGENNVKELSSTLFNSFVIVAIINISLLLIIQLFCPLLFKATVASPLIESKMESFMAIRSWGILFSIFELCFFAYYTGRGKTFPVMFATLAQGLSNFIFDYGLIFGNWGMPELGLEGAAWSTVISDAFSATTYLLFFLWSRKESELKHFLKNKINAKQLKDLLKLGTPLIGQGFISVGSWVVFFFMIENMGQKQIEISQTIRNFYYICLISVLSFGTTTKTIVSKLMAENKQNEIKSALKKIVWCSLLCTLFFTHANFFYPQVIIPLINANTTLLDETVLTLQLVSLAMILYAISIVLTGMISGAGDTVASFRIELASIILYIVMGALVTIVFPQPIHIVWCIEYVYFGAIIVAAMLYIRKGHWKSITV